MLQVSRWFLKVANLFISSHHSRMQEHLYPCLPSRSSSPSPHFWIVLHAGLQRRLLCCFTNVNRRVLTPFHFWFTKDIHGRN